MEKSKNTIHFIDGGCIEVNDKEYKHWFPLVQNEPRLRLRRNQAGKIEQYILENDDNEPGEYIYKSFKGDKFENLKDTSIDHKNFEHDAFLFATNYRKGYEILIGISNALIEKKKIIFIDFLEISNYFFNSYSNAFVDNTLSNCDLVIVTGFDPTNSWMIERNFMQLFDKLYLLSIPILIYSRLSFEECQRVLSRGARNSGRNSSQILISFLDAFNSTFNPSIEDGNVFQLD